jgi:putative ABC transport system permease protein
MAAKGASIRELVADALSNLYALRLRSALALLGIVIGAGSVIAMLTIGHMAEREALRVFSRMGLQTLVATATLPNPAAPGFDRGDIEALSRRVAAVAESAPITIASVAVDVDGATQAVNVSAATPAMK